MAAYRNSLEMATIILNDSAKCSRKFGNGLGFFTRWN
jgi:hypothetical protein